MDSKHRFKFQGTLASVGGYQTGTLVDAQNRVVGVSFANGMMTNYTYNDWLNGTGRLFSIQSQNQNTGETYQHQTYSYDYAGNLTNIIDYVNSWQIQSFTYDSLNRLLFATTDGVGYGQYQQDYQYDSYTGNLLNRSDVGTYTYAQSKPHAVSSAGTNTYVYDANGNMTHRNDGNTQWEYAYDAENRLVEVEKDRVTENRYYYDGDGNRVVRLGADNTGTVFISNYFEAVYPHNAIPEPPPPVTEGGGENEPNAPNPIPQGDITYYYAGSQRIALRDANGVYFLLSDHLGSSSIVMDASGQVVEEGYYMPWGGERGDQGIATTDYGFTGQMREGDIYFYNARWYDPAIGRFMQADTIVPMASQGTQAFDRYAYVNNNPLRYIDPTGQWCRSTNLMMSDGGGASIEGYLNNIDNNYYWDARGEWTINELAQLNDFGIKLTNRISSINDGRGLEWIQHNTAGMVIEKGTFGQEAIIFLLNLLSRQRIAGTVPSITNSGQVYIDSNYFSDDLICHEMTHVIDNVMGAGWFTATWVGKGPADDFTTAMGGESKGTRWNNHLNVNGENIFSTTSRLNYGNSATAEYFAVGFTEFLLYSDPQLSVNMVNWFTDFVKRTTP